MWRILKTLQYSKINRVKFTLKIKSIIKYNHSTKFKFKTNQTLTMETILIITKKKKDVLW